MFTNLLPTLAVLVTGTIFFVSALPEIQTGNASLRHWLFAAFSIVVFAMWLFSTGLSLAVKFWDKIPDGGKNFLVKVVKICALVMHPAGWFNKDEAQRHFDSLGNSEVEHKGYPSGIDSKPKAEKIGSNRASRKPYALGGQSVSKLVDPTPLPTENSAETNTVLPALGSEAKLSYPRLTKLPFESSPLPTGIIRKQKADYPAFGADQNQAKFLDLG